MSYCHYVRNPTSNESRLKQPFKGFEGNVASNKVVQGSAKRWSLGCVNLPPAARGTQEAGFTQPRAGLLADPMVARWLQPDF